MEDGIKLSAEVIAERSDKLRSKERRVSVGDCTVVCYDRKGMNYVTSIILAQPVVSRGI